MLVSILGGFLGHFGHFSKPFPVALVARAVALEEG
jgi:hypothetical protein